MYVTLARDCYAVFYVFSTWAIRASRLPVHPRRRPKRRPRKLLKELSHGKTLTVEHIMPVSRANSILDVVTHSGWEGNRKSGAALAMHCIL